MSEADATGDLFRPRLVEMIDLKQPLAVLASQLPWTQIEVMLAPHFARRAREGRAIEGEVLFGPTLQFAGASVSTAGRPRLPMRLMVCLLYLKHAFKLSDEELVRRWSENVVWQHLSRVAESSRPKQTGPVVGARAGLHADQAWRDRGDEVEELDPGNRWPHQHRLAGGMYSMNDRDGLRQADAQSDNGRYGWLPLSSVTMRILIASERAARCLARADQRPGGLRG